MKRTNIMFYIVLAILLILVTCTQTSPATSTPVTPASIAAPSSIVKEAWEMEWERVVADAKKEGRLVVASTAGASLREEIIEGFKNNYGIPVEMLSGTGSQISAKILAERRAGLYLEDIYLGGADTALTLLKPAGVFDSLEPILILPEVTDPVKTKELWLGGKLGWVDSEKTVLHFLYDVTGGFLINRRFLKSEEFTSYRDLLKPEWKGKIVMSDPTRTGGGGKWAIVIGSQIMGWDYLYELAKQEPAITTNERIQLDWMAQGKYLIGTGASAESVYTMEKEGVPFFTVAPKEGGYIGGGGSGFIILINRAPHPKAAKVFINWYLTKEAQTAHVKAVGNPSRRLDVSKEGINPLKISQPGVKYFNPVSEEFILMSPKLYEKSREIFGPLMK